MVAPSERHRHFLRREIARRMLGECGLQEPRVGQELRPRRDGVAGVAQLGVHDALDRVLRESGDRGCLLRARPLEQGVETMGERLLLRRAERVGDPGPPLVGVVAIDRVPQLAFDAARMALVASPRSDALMAVSYELTTSAVAPFWRTSPASIQMLLWHNLRIWFS